MDPDRGFRQSNAALCIAPRRKTKAMWSTLWDRLYEIDLGEYRPEKRSWKADKALGLDVQPVPVRMWRQLKW